MSTTSRLQTITFTCMGLLSLLFTALSVPAQSTALRRAGLLLLLIVVSTSELQGDTTGLPRSAPPAGCYCHCAVSAARNACTKMCELPRYASRWWATTCAKPRASSPAENHDAGPRLAHPGRAERASN